MAVKVGRTFVYGEFEQATFGELIAGGIAASQGFESEPEFAVEIVREYSANEFVGKAVPKKCLEELDAG